MARARVSLHDLAERRDASVVHVRCCERDVAQRRHAELAVRHPVADESGCYLALPDMTDVAREIESLVTRGTARACGEEELHSAPRLFGESSHLAAVHQPVVRRVTGDEPALERCQRLRHIVSLERPALTKDRP